MIEVNEKAPITGAEPPYIKTLEGFKIPIYIEHGLPYIHMRPYTDDEKDRLPHVTITSDSVWDPKIADYEIEETWYDEQDEDIEFFQQNIVDENGELTLEGFEEERTDKFEMNHTMIKAYFHELIRDELYHDDEETDTSEHEESVRQCNDSERVPRRSERNKAPVDYNPKPKRSIKKKRSKNGKKTAGNSRTKAVRKQDDEDSFEGAPRTDFSNPAKSTERDNDGIEVGPYLIKPAKKDYADYARHFCGATELVIEKTFKATTQYGRTEAGSGIYLWKQSKSPNPAMNFPRRNEPVATDTIYVLNGEPAIDDGSTAAQFFIGRKSDFRSIRPCGKTDGQFARTFYDEIRRYGAMDVIISDSAKSEISKRVQEILRTLVIRDWQSEPHNKNQNYAERGWRDTKRTSATLLNYSGAPDEIWLLSLQYVCFVLNHTARERLGWRTPIEWLLGTTPDITVLLRFIFWEPVYYLKYENETTKKSEVAVGRFVGISEHVGHAMTYKILTEGRKVIRRAVIRTANKHGVFRNKRAIAASPNMAPKKPSEKVVPETVNEEDEDEGEDSKTEEPDESEDFLKSAMDDAVEHGEPLPTIDIDSLLNRTFITSPDEHGEQTRAKVLSAQPLIETTADGSEQLHKFKCKVGTKVFEEVMSYNQMLDWCERDAHKDDMHTFSTILDHKKVARKNKRGSDWWVLVKWDSAKASWNTLDYTWQGDPTTVAMYAMKNDLLELSGWRRCKRYTKNAKTMARMANQAKLRSFRNKPVYKYGYQVPRTHQEAMFIDEKAGNDKWAKNRRRPNSTNSWNMSLSKT